MIVQTLLIVAPSLVSSHHNHHMDTTTRLSHECPRGPNIGGDNSCTPLHTTSMTSNIHLAFSKNAVMASSSKINLIASVNVLTYNFL